MVKGKGKAVPLQTWTGPEGSRKLRFPDFVTTAQYGGRLSSLPTGRLYPQEILGLGLGLSRCKLPDSGGPEGDPGPDYVACVFNLLGSIVISGVYKLTHSDQA